MYSCLIFKDVGLQWKRMGLGLFMGCVKNKRNTEYCKP